MTKRISVFLMVAAVPAGILILFVHSIWLLELSLGLLAVLFLATYISASSGTGHVLDGLVSAVISSILIVVLAVGIQRHLDRSRARERVRTEMSVPDKTLEPARVGALSSAVAVHVSWTRVAQLCP